jgi:diguanylate cyclase (GGDEF)-like protein/PAS domain S-box-containing protein
MPMIELIEKLFSSDTFIPHGHCYLWQPELLWLHILSDSLIALAYYSIPLTLVYFVQKRKDLPFDWIFLLFSAFIVSCGTTHLMEIWTLWHPTYWLSGVLKAITAFISIYTAMTLVELMPLALTLPSPAQMTLINQNLEQQIRDRQETEKSLELQAVILRNMAEGICLVRADNGVIVYANPKFEQMFGYDSQELDGQHVSIVNYPNETTTPEEVNQSIRAAVLAKGEHTYEVQNIKKDRTPFWCSATTSVFKHPDFGDVLVAVQQDVSDRKQAEIKLEQLNQELEQRIAGATAELTQTNERLQEELIEREKLQRELLQREQLFNGFFNAASTANIGLCIHDRDLSYLQINQALADIHGLSIADHLGKTCTEIIPNIAINLVPALKSVIETGEAIDKLEVSGTIPSQTDVLCYWLVSLFPIFGTGEEVSAVGKIVLEISDRKQIEESLRQSEEQLRLALDVTHIGFWDLDMLTQRIIWNDNHFTLFGLDQNAIEPSIQAWEERIHPEDRDRVAQCFADSLKNKTDYEAEYRVVRPDGNPCWLLGKGKAVYNESGQPIRSIGLILDINDRKLAQEKMQTINQQLESSVGELRQKNQEMQLVGEISDFLQSCLTVEEACATISTLAKPLFPNCTVGIFMIANSRNRLELINSWGNTDSLDSVFLPNDCWALRRGRSHWIGQDQHELLCKHTDHHHPTAESLCIPMIAQGETLGLLHLSSSIPGNLIDSRRQLARTISEQLSLAIANLTLRATLQAQSIRDPLTGLFNRRYLEEFFHQEIHRAQRNEYSVGVIMIDIDHFKRFNDTLGHDGGDFILKEVGQLLKDAVRPSDIACRFGGEEMILILPDVSLEIACQRAEWIRNAIAQLRLVYNGSAIDTVTASFGVACFPDHGATVNAVIKTADHALYRAKDGGRNQVVVGIISTILEKEEYLDDPKAAFRLNPQA